MVQGYPEEDSPCSGFGCSLIGIRNAGKSFANSGIKARIGFSAFLSYWTSNPGGYPHEQWCSYQSEKFKLRRFEKLGGETGGLMLNITGLNHFSLFVIFMICAVNMIRFYPSSISSWTVSRKMVMSLSWCLKIYVWFVCSAMTDGLTVCLRDVLDPDTSLCR